MPWGAATVRVQRNNFNERSEASQLQIRFSRKVAAVAVLVRDPSANNAG
jgi:glutamine amidotransferase PdxT